MKYLLKEWNKIRDQYFGKHIFLFLDYDGTLSPIASTPVKAKTPLKVLDALRALTTKSFITTTFISGRSLKNIKEKIGLKKMIYAGNHGMEISGPSMDHKVIPIKIYAAIKGQIKADIQNKTKGIKGVLLEDKGLTLALHYRMVKQKDVRAVKNAFKGATSKFKTNGSIQIQTGKKVYEVGPNIDWDKGKAVMWILDQYKKDSKYHAPIYIGDDTTDEDAFKTLKNKGLTVFVGKPKISYARYFVRNISEVIRFLQMLACSRERQWV